MIMWLIQKASIYIMNHKSLWSNNMSSLLTSINSELMWIVTSSLILGNDLLKVVEDCRKTGRMSSAIL